MISLIAGSLVLSVLHALIPNHWLPILAIARKENWSVGQTTRITLLAGLSHASSTVLIGLLLALVGARLADVLVQSSQVAGASLLVALGVYFIYQHSRHHHFHLHGHPEKASHSRIVVSLAAAMFLSPCFEIEPYFLLAGAQGLWFAGLIAILYTVVTVTGMILWVRFTYKTLLKLNWHALEHNAGIITGVTLIATGLLSLFVH
jgi:nickel/cobalt transporter (NicO) family protein